MTITVSNATQLVAALKAAKGGETIALNPGDYGALNVWSLNFASNVTITSVDPNHQASFSGLKITNITNLTFNGVQFNYHAAPGTSLEASPFLITNGTNVTVTNSTFHGDKAVGVGALYDGFGTGNGLAIRDSTNTTISNNTFEGFHRGITVHGANGINVSGNDLSNMSSDGMDFAQVKNAVVDSNHIHDFHRSAGSGDHPDMIQFWTAGTTSASSNVVVKNNLLDQGEGMFTQSIFMGNEMVSIYGKGLDWYYSNFTITNNVIRNSHLHGITVGPVNGLTIDHNTLIQSTPVGDGGMVTVPKINVDTKALNVTIADNVVPTLSGTLTTGGTGWHLSNNFVATIDNPDAVNYIGKLFYNALDSHTALRSDFLAVNGSQIGNLHVGAQLNSPGYHGYIENHQTGGSHFTSPHQTLDISHIFDGQGKLVTSGASVTWDFGDGTQGTGLVANHVYATAGNFTATAYVTLQNGSHLQVQKTFLVASSDQLDLNFNTSAADQSPVVNAVTLTGASLVTTTGGGQALSLNGGTAKYHADFGFDHNSEYTVTLDFKKNPGQEAGGGTLVYFSGAYSIYVNGDSISASITTSHGLVWLTAKNVGVANTDWHRVGFVFSGLTGTADLLVDGHKVAHATGLAGEFQTHSTNADFYLGSPYGKSFAGLIDNVHMANVAVSDANLTTGTLATPHADFAHLTTFDPVSAFATTHSTMPVAVMPAHDATMQASAMPALVHHDFLII